MLQPALDINSYKRDGFELVCKPQRCWDGTWIYEDINENIMFDDHRSWVYFIVVNDEIVKIGETGNPLGIRATTCNVGQPKCGSKSRFGRYRSGDSTDEMIRESLAKDVRAGRVTLWARKCEMLEIGIKIRGMSSKTLTTFHKDLELRYLDEIYQQTGTLPLLNKARK